MQSQSRMWRTICIREIQRSLSTRVPPQFARDTIIKKGIAVNWLAIKLHRPGKGIEEREGKNNGNNNDQNIHSAAPIMEHWYRTKQLFTPVFTPENKEQENTDSMLQLFFRT